MLKEVKTELTDQKMLKKSQEKTREKVLNKKFENIGGLYDR